MGQMPAMDDRQTGVRVIDLMQQHRPLVRLVHRHDQRAETGDRLPDDDMFDAAGDHHQHPVTLDHAALGQPTGPAVYLAVKFAIGQAPLVHDQTDLVGHTPRVILDQKMKNALAALLIDRHCSGRLLGLPRLEELHEFHHRSIGVINTENQLTGAAHLDPQRLAIGFVPRRHQSVIQRPAVPDLQT